MQHTLQPAEKNFYMLENLWTKLVSNRFMEIMMNINIYNYTMCVCVCVYIAMIKWYNFVVLQKKAMISCIFTISFCHWRNDDKTKQHIHSILPDGVNFDGSWWLKLAPNDSHINATAEIFRSLNHTEEMNARKKNAKNKKKKQRPVNATMVQQKSFMCNVYSRHESRKHTNTHSRTHKYLCRFLCQQLFFKLPWNCSVLFIFAWSYLKQFFFIWFVLLTQSVPCACVLNVPIIHSTPLSSRLDCFAFFLRQTV